ncbi:unnamed protein product [Phytomonas sp. Hart1]|nr:unnamed protein product [Phytomonas sp. Hart1]|eukprot:CCW66102.1 unnamed protein product [Phytomonas sp. isolate Hart1]
MPALLIAGKNIFSLRNKALDIECEKIGTLPHDAVSAACFETDSIYYVSEYLPDSLMSWTPTEPAKFITKFPYSLRKIIFYHNKVFCAQANSHFIFAYDPLSLVIETLEMPCEVLNFEPGDNGFVIENKTGDLYGYSFDNGMNKVQQLVNAKLIGNYRNSAVALVASNSDAISVTEEGKTYSSTLSSVENCFVVEDNDVIQLDRHKKALIYHNDLSRPIPSSSKYIHLLHTPTMDTEQICTMCLCELDESPSLTLDCGHQFHIDCVLEWVNNWDEFRKKGNHISFNRGMCPGGCKHLVRHPLIYSTSRDIKELYDKVSLQRREIIQVLYTTKSQDDLLFYVCSKCAEPFLGGENSCFRMQGGEPAKDPNSLLCDNCQTDFFCPTHGRKYVIYKCTYCCNPATHRSFATRYLCDRCEERWVGSTEVDKISCPGPNVCPLGGHHDTTCAYPVGCLLCLPEYLLAIDFIIPPSGNGDENKLAQ